MAELTEKSQRKSVLERWTMVVYIAGMLIFAFHACTHMVAAGDTWVAMACGRHFANHPVDTVEPFSFNSHKAGPTEAEIRTWPKWAQSIANKFDIETVRKWHPTGWVNQNWLTHLIFYKLATFGQPEGKYNYDALVWWKFTIYFIAAFCIYYTGRLMGVSVPGAAFAAAMGLFIGRTFLDIRPAGYANLLVAVYLLVLALTVYRHYLWIWLVVPITVFWANVHGGYIYVFIMGVPFVLINLVSIPFKKRFVSVGLKGLYHAIGAGLTAFAAMILFNPFKLTNLTHTFEISVSKHAESWRRVNEWHSAFEWANPVGDEIPFTVMFVIAWVVLLAWFVVWAFMKPELTDKRNRKSQAPVPAKPGEYEWPKVNAASIVIAALTVYMAVKSRRFIPLGGFAACPVIMLLFENTIKMFSVRSQFAVTRQLILPEMPVIVRKWIFGFGCAAVLLFGAFWGGKYYKVYLATWCNDATYDFNPEKRDSVFMRMTASNIKPFDVCQFIRDNNISGKMFNYWTEGGALAFGQTPDPETGKTPLRLFMDGRAQAAYNHDKFQLWQRYYSGGPGDRTDLTIPIRIARRFATNKELEEIGNWIDERMKEEKIWVFVLPNSEFALPEDPIMANYFPIALQRNRNWRLAYLDDYQQMYVDYSDPRGEKLIRQVYSGEAKFPNEYIEKLTQGQLCMILQNEQEQIRGLELAEAALDTNPSQMTMSALTHTATKRPVLRGNANEFIESFVTDFINKKAEYEKQGGYVKRLTAGLLGSRYLSDLYKGKDKEKKRQYSQFSEQCLDERKELSLKAKW